MINFEPLKKLDIKSCIDIGAHIGEFFSNARHNLKLKSEDCLLIEANKHCEYNLKSFYVDYKIIMLSDQKKTIPYYRAKHDEKCTGNSYYRELTTHYRDENLDVELIETDMLDNITNKKFDLIKIDTQGSEIDILKGGLKTLSHAKAVILETSVIAFNKGAPLQDEVIAFMKNNNFYLNAILDENLIQNQNIHQQDLLFLK
jgi:FkbM family methyltransferase